MITAFRRLAGTWFAKGLFVVLVLSFAIWGIEDVVRNFGRDNAVARVGGEAIELTEAQNAARRETQRLQRQLGPRFEANAEFNQAIARQAVETLIAERAQRLEARRVGVAVSADLIRDYTFSIPTFQGVDGRFNRLLLDQFMRQNDMTEADFLRVVVADIQRQQLVGAVRSGARAPTTMTRLLLSYEAERRAADVVELPLLSAPEIPDPTEAQLTRFHENNPAQFSSPEMREAVMALLTADALMARVAVTDRDIDAALQQHPERGTVPERRTMEMVLVSSEEAAREIRTAWTGGADFAAVTARATAAGGQAIELGSLDKGSVPVPELADSVFALPEGGVSEPVRSPFGWHVIRVASIQAQAARPAEEIRAEVRQELQREKAADQTYEEANRLEDALAGGATVEETARRFELTPVRVRVDRQGNDESGRRVELPGGPGAREAVLTAIFANPPGPGGRLADVPEGFLALEVPNATPAALKPFATVENEVRRAWMLDARRRAQEERAAGLLAATRSGKTLEQAAQEAGLEVVRMGPSPRTAQQGVPNAIPAELLPGLFEAKVGDVTMAQTAAGYAVARLAEIVRADPGADPEGLTRVKGEVETAMQEDLESQFAAALRARSNVTINQPLMDQVAQR
ncbi:SurA N-terminal domain-containing protein [Muricoccus radiodurans]|uniref:peptidylprolyl isomerase n=1 Tax=Muricoccus radiodurans TaxID=2231721 RepID=UPI003CE97BF1